ncbi:MAG TPA: NADP-dependent oxidoreductase [Candidatus Limnocylindria bacterium]|nr:NADP-dependent oxidoreductase [Candidatus Limnocylindria bacterium]
MKAAQFKQYGDPSVVVVTEADKPTVGQGQVLVEVRAASLNPWDTAVRQGGAKDFMPLELPVTAGGDLAGIVTEAGPDVTQFAVGDKVYGGAGVPGGSGAFAQFAVADAGHIAKAPVSLDFTQAAALPLVGSSAVQALTEHLQLQSGQKILIHGGSGGIGSIAVQIAKHIGAYVATTVPTEALELAKQLGADEVIDYKTQDFTQLIRDYDAVFDTVGGEVFEKSLSVLRPGGTAVSMLGKVDESTAKEQNVTAITQSTRATTERLDKLTGLVEQGAVQPSIGKIFPLDQVQEAFQARESGKVTGKVVLKVKA